MALAASGYKDCELHSLCSRLACQCNAVFALGNELWIKTIRDRVPGINASAIYHPAKNPLLAGGLVISPDDYMKFLDKCARMLPMLVLSWPCAVEY